MICIVYNAVTVLSKASFSEIKCLPPSYSLAHTASQKATTDYKFTPRLWRLSTERREKLAIF